MASKGTNATYFEVQLSPLKAAKQQQPEEEIEVLVLAPFKPVPKIIFDNIKVNQEVKRTLIIKNPSTSTVSVQLARLPPAERNINFNFTSVDLGASDEAKLELTWVPQEAGNWRESIPLRTSTKFKTDLVICFSSVDPNAGKNRKKPLATRNPPRPTVVAKKLVTTKPRTPKSQARSRGASHSVVQQEVRVVRLPPGDGSSSPCRRKTFLVNAENKENSAPGPAQRKVNTVKQLSITNRFEDFVLSPVTCENRNIQSALDNLVMTPVVLHEKRETIFGGASKRTTDIEYEGSFEKCGAASGDDLPDCAVSPVALRRTTYAVPVSKRESVSHVGEERMKISLTTISSCVDLPEIVVSPAKDKEDEALFDDSLDEAQTCEPLPHPKRRVIPAPRLGSLDFDADFSFPGQPHTQDADMMSSLVFNPPLPSEDPRRCSTGIKNPTNANSDISPYVCKDLFSNSPLDMLNHTSGVEPFNLPRESDRLSCGTYVKDRLSSETYTKDRLSTETYVKDRLSTETYVKDQHSHGSDHISNYSDPREVDSSSCRLSETRPSVNMEDISPVCHQKKIPLQSIVEEEISPESLCHKRKATAFTVDINQSNPPKKKLNVASSLVVSPPTRRKSSGGQMRLIRVSPTLKKSTKNLLHKQPAQKKKDSPKQLMRPDRLSFGGTSQKNLSALHSSTGTRRMSLGPPLHPAPRAQSSHVQKKAIPSTSQSRLSLARVLPRCSQKIAKRQKEQSEFLFDPEEFLSAKSKVDPFSATTTTDPFLNSNLYYDDEWRVRQEKDMIKWLNALLTPPAELEANTDALCIDIAELWQKSRRQKEVGLAPSREEVSSDLYLTGNRLTTLRRSAMALLRSPQVEEVLQKVSTNVEKKLLAVREDRDLHVDVGLQYTVLDLLLCYNPLWLRIGLEIVYGRTVALTSNSDVVGLATFIVHNLLTDSHIVATHSHPTVPHLKLPGFQEAMKKFTLRKFLFIVYFLDRAKSTMLIRHDPCLFLRNAKYKESREIVAAFARELLAGVGDINRHLSVLGYKLTVKQTYLDEFEYAVKSLHDLRDGVRLTRIMELILRDQQLLCKLRVPAISKLQKIHNMEVALQALTQAGYVICGDIQAKHLVEGHREKTLSLLWQIIYKFRAPRFTDAAVVIQRWWRRRQLPLELERRIQARKMARCVAAATRIQTAWRGFDARRRLARLLELAARQRAAREAAAVVVQKYWRGLSARLRLRRARAAVSTIVAWYRGATATRCARSAFIQQRAAATAIQAQVRGYLTRKRFAELRRTAAALRILTWYRRQRTARCLLAAAPLARAWLESRRRTLTACRTIQARLRATLAMKRDRARYLSLRTAAVAVQQRFRAQLAMKIQRTHFLELKRSTVAIQQRFRAQICMRRQLSQFATLKSATMTIQRHTRAHQAMKRARSDFLAKRSAAVVIQQRFRARIAMKRDRVDFLMTRTAVVLLQRRVRAWLVMKRERACYLTLRQAAIRAQRRFRTHIAHMMNQRCAAVTIQRRFRALRVMRGQRASFLALREAVLLTQRRFRAQREMKAARAQYCELRAAALTVQREFRARREGRQLRGAYVALREAALATQRRWRAKLAMRRDREQLDRTRGAVVVLQRRWRARVAMHQQIEAYQKQRAAAIAIQRKWRATLAARQQSARFKQVRAAALVVQRRWRALAAMRKHRGDFCELRRAAVVLQRRWRALSGMRRHLEDYKSLRSAAIAVQRKWRATLSARRESARFQALRAAVLVLQGRWRARALMLRQRTEFLRLRAAAAVLQGWWRARAAGLARRAEYQAVRSAAICIQRRWRARVAMGLQREAFHVQRGAVIALQRWWRRTRLMLSRRREFLRLRSAAVTVQARWRARQSMRAEKQRFDRMRCAAILIERRWRAHLAMKPQREWYLQLIRFTILVQCRYRALRQMRRARAARAASAAERHAALVIQKCVRRFLATTRVRRLREQAEEFARLQDSSARIIQGWWRMHSLAQIDKKRRELAAIKIQCVWRGYAVRSKLSEEAKAIKMRAVEAIAKADSQPSVYANAMKSLDVLRNSDSVAQVCTAFNSLDIMSQLVPELCLRLVENGVVYSITHALLGTNRSVAHLDAVTNGTKVLLNLCKYNKTISGVWQDGDSLLVFIFLMKKWVGKGDTTFLNCLTILWHFSLQHPWAEAMTLNDKLRSALAFCEGKLKVKGNRKTSESKLLPSTVPNWGKVAKQSRPYAFKDPVFGLHALYSKLKIRQH